MEDKIIIGDVVSISQDAVYFMGRQISPLIKSKKWVVKSISGNRVILGKSDDGYYNLNMPIDMKYLSKVDL
jgi:hypothetical protein